MRCRRYFRHRAGKRAVYLFGAVASNVAGTGAASVALGFHPWGFPEGFALSARIQPRSVGEFDAVRRRATDVLRPQLQRQWNSLVGSIGVRAEAYPGVPIGRLAGYGDGFVEGVRSGGYWVCGEEKSMVFAFDSVLPMRILAGLQALVRVYGASQPAAGMLQRSSATVGGLRGVERRQTNLAGGGACRRRIAAALFARVCALL